TLLSDLRSDASKPPGNEDSGVYSRVPAIIWHARLRVLCGARYRTAGTHGIQHDPAGDAGSPELHRRNRPGTARHRGRAVPDPGRAARPTRLAKFTVPRLRHACP